MKTKHRSMGSKAVGCRMSEDRRTEVDEARTRVDPEALADNDIHRLVRVTA